MHVFTSLAKQIRFKCLKQTASLWYTCNLTVNSKREFRNRKPNLFAILTDFELFVLFEQEYKKSIKQRNFKNLFETCQPASHYTMQLTNTFNILLNN